MKCHQCDAEVEAGSKFCTECGARMEAEIACRHCDEQIPANSAFCTNCGKPNQPAPSPAEVATTKDAAQPTLPQSDDFLFLLSEEMVQTLASKNENPVCGYQGAVLQNGRLIEVLKESEGPDEIQKGFISRLWSKVKEVWNKAPEGVLGTLDGPIQCFVVMDLGNLPVVSYSHPNPSAGLPNASLKFDFWVEAEDLALFVQRCAQGRSSLTLLEFKKIATEQARQLVKQWSSDDLASGWGELYEVSEGLKKASGISSRCVLVEGKVGQRHHFDVTKHQASVECSNCGYELTTPMKFCEDCGKPLDPSSWVNATTYLMSADGDQITLKVSFLLDDSTNQYFGEGKVSWDVIQALGPTIRSRKTSDLMAVDVLDVLSKELSEKLRTAWRGFASDISVMDIRTASEEWFFQSDALVKEELRKVESQRSLLKVDESKLDLQEAAFALTMRSLKQRNFEGLEVRRANLESRKQEAELELEEHRLEAGVDLQKENLEAQLAQERLERDRNMRRSNVSEDRKDELDQVSHDTSLEKKLAQHDIDLANMAADAQSQQARRSVDDATYAQNADLLMKAKVAQTLGNIQEDLQDRQNNREVSKLQAMADLEARMAQQDQAFEMSKIESMKSLDAQQILALQAAQLAKTAGGGQATADLIKSIAEAQAAAAGASIKDELYNKMLDAQQKSTEQLIQAQKEASKASQSASDKSMDLMAKVATASITKKDPKAAEKGGDDSESDEKTKSVACVNPDCKTIFKVKIPKVCGDCGTPQAQKDEKEA